MRIILLILAIVISQAAFAQYCVQLTQECVEKAESRNIEGYLRFRDCWKYKVNYQCFDEDYNNYCSAIDQAPGCDQVSNICIDKGQDGTCNKFRLNYRCGSTFQGNELVLLNSEYTIARDEIDNTVCDQQLLNQQCQEVKKVCIEGPETRTINGKEIFKDCWKYEAQHICYNSSKVSDCEEYEKKCQLVAEKCLSKECLHKEKKYACSEVVGQSALTMQCNGAQYCVGSNCTQTELIPNKNIGKAITSLSMLRNMQSDFELDECLSNSANCKVFKGESKSCRINPLGSRNCCQEKGWLTDIKLAECTQEEAALNKAKENSLCHETGSYCANEILGICTQIKRSYCCFQSKLSKIIHEYGRVQLGINWGSSEQPNCRSLTVEELQKIDFSKVDLSALYLEPMNKANSKHTSESDELIRRIKSHYEN